MARAAVAVDNTIRVEREKAPELSMCTEWRLPNSIFNFRTGVLDPELGQLEASFLRWLNGDEGDQ